MTPSGRNWSRVNIFIARRKMGKWVSREVSLDIFGVAVNIKLDVWFNEVSGNLVM